MINLYIEIFKNFGYLSLYVKDERIIKIDFHDKFNNKSSNTPMKSEKIAYQFFETFSNYLNGSRVDFNFPYHLEGLTDFESLILKNISDIPYGETLSYKQLADISGRPNSFRAVGNACSKNRIPLIIPCHRVIRSDGGLGGFKDGVSFKKKLLLIEKGAIL